MQIVAHANLFWARHVFLQRLALNRTMYFSPMVIASDI